MGRASQQKVKDTDDADEGNGDRGKHDKEQLRRAYKNKKKRLRATFDEQQWRGYKKGKRDKLKRSGESSGKVGEERMKHCANRE